MSHYNMTTPCDACPFLNTPNNREAFPLRRLKEFADEGEFHCHKTGDCDEEESVFVANANSSICAGMLIFNEKRKRPNQMMRISERIGLYDRSKLNMRARVR